MIPRVVADAATHDRFTHETRSYSMAATRSGKYDVLWVSSLYGASSRRALSRFRGRCALIVTTPTVGRLYAAGVERLLRSCGIACETVTIPGGERSKSWATVEFLCSSAYSHNLGRTDLFVSLSGGVCSDVVSVAASLFRRGIGVVRIPTNLIAQVDAAIGVKGAINHANKKNGLGVYAPPELVLVDTTFLRTTDVSNIRNGLAEILKIAIVRDADLFELTLDRASDLAAPSCSIVSGDASAKLNEIVRTAGIAMLDELASNLYEDQTYRRLVDFGHTFSPLLEAASGFAMRHGEAVAVDTALSAAIAVELKLLARRDCDTILAALIGLGLPVFARHLTSTLFQAAVDDAARHRGGHVNLVVPTRLGAADFVVDRTELTESLFASAACMLGRRYE